VGHSFWYLLADWSPAGFAHEQSRPDRDEHIEVNEENIQGNLKDNFIKMNYTDRKAYDGDSGSSQDLDQQLTPYDWTSVMHYK
jgi:hypothetical protein